MNNISYMRNAKTIHCSIYDIIFIILIIIVVVVLIIIIIIILWRLTFLIHPNKKLLHNTVPLMVLKYRLPFPNHYSVNVLIKRIICNVIYVTFWLSVKVTGSSLRVYISTFNLLRKIAMTIYYEYI